VARRRTVNGERRTEDRRQKTEDRRQKTEDRRPQTRNSELRTPMTYTFSNKFTRVLWLVVYVFLFRFSPRPWHWWRSFLLRCFGARIDQGCHIYGAARIWAPWNLVCYSGACVADQAEIYNPVKVTLGEGAVISQGAFLCGASHDYADPAFPIVEAPITVGKRAWIAARAIVLMGVNVGEGSVRSR